MKPIAWYDPSNGMVSTDQDCPLFTPLGQVWGLYLKEEAKDEPYAFEASMYSNDRMKVDPVTGNVSIGTPQRTWVGLTDEDEIDWEEGGNLKDLVKSIEAKLKEKNT
jgi:hypothetical protein